MDLLCCKLLHTLQSDNLVEALVLENLTRGSWTMRVTWRKWTLGLKQNSNSPPNRVVGPETSPGLKLGNGVSTGATKRSTTCSLCSLAFSFFTPQIYVSD